MTERGPDPNGGKHREGKRWIRRWPRRLILGVVAAALILIALRLPQVLAAMRVRQLHGQLDWGAGSSLPQVYRIFFWIFGKVDGITLHGSTVTNADAWVFQNLHECRYVSLTDTKLTSGLAALNREHDLHHLFLNNNTRITDADLLELHFSSFPHLAAVALTFSPMVTGMGFAGPRDCPSLEFLSVGFCPSFSNGALAAVCRFTNLRTLVLSGTSVTDSGLKRLVELKNLHSIVLNQTLVTDDGMRTLSHVKGLRDISLAGDKITVLGLRYLSKLPRLRYLNLAGDGINDGQAKTVLGSGIRVDLRNPPAEALLLFGG